MDKFKQKKMMNIGWGGIFVFYLSRPTDPANYIISNYLVAYFMGFSQNIFEHGHNSTLNKTKFTQRILHESFLCFYLIDLQNL